MLLLISTPPASLDATEGSTASAKLACRACQQHEECLGLTAIRAAVRRSAFHSTTGPPQAVLALPTPSVLPGLCSSAAAATPQRESTHSAAACDAVGATGRRPCATHPRWQWPRQQERGKMTEFLRRGAPGMKVRPLLELQGPAAGLGGRPSCCPPAAAGLPSLGLAD